jgi:glycosyltransferase involved in cell wall biosynthesis
LVRFRPQLVYIPISQTTLGYYRDSVYIWLARLFSCKVVCHLRGGYFRKWLAEASVLTRAYVQLTHRRIQGQIVLGECLKPLFDGYVARHRVHVVPNGKDYEVTPIQPRNKPPTKVLFLANMIRTKGVLDVLEAARILDSNEIEFVFAGAWHEPEIQQDIEKFLRDNSRLNITWLGAVSAGAKRRAFEGADMFVFPTFYPPEGHPWVIVEAMAAGLPIITTDQGAIRESVVDGVNGFIVEKQNPEQLAQKIQQLVNDRTLRAEMSQQSRQRYLNHFTEQRMVDRMSGAWFAVMNAN